MRVYKTQHRYYCGVDLHARSLFVNVLDHTGTTLLKLDLPASPTAFLDAVQPYRDGLVGGVRVHVRLVLAGRPLRTRGDPLRARPRPAMKAIHGGKAKNDRLDAEKIAGLLEGGFFPMARRAFRTVVESIARCHSVKVAQIDDGTITGVSRLTEFRYSELFVSAILNSPTPEPFMFRLNLGTSDHYCDGVSRRNFLQLGVAGMAAVGLPELLRAKEASPGSSKSAKGTSVILLWLDGGPSHIDMYDMKPDAPAEYRGLWKPIRTKVPGFDITELFPKQAKQTDKFSMVRSLHHDTGDHFAGAHRMITTKDMGVSGANTAPKFPGIGAIVDREVGARRRGMPGHVASPHSASVGLVPGYFGGQMLGAEHDPFLTGDPNTPNFQVRNFNLAAGLTLQKMEDRRTLLNHFDKSQAHLAKHPSAMAMDRFGEEAFEFVTGPQARKAFDIGKEDVRLRDRYGRNSFGQSTLLARRLVEAGSTFVTVHSGGWDHHWDLKESYERMLPQVDAAVASLFEDLDDRGLLDTTLVVLCGEFGRTPKMNDGGNGGAPMSKGTPGRDHWGDAMFCLMGGGGVKGGQIVGSTDRLGRRPQTGAVTPSNVHATIYRVLGIDPKLQLLEPGGRPVNVLDDPTPISELL